MQDKANDISKQISSTPIQQPITTQLSYSSIVASQIPAMLDQAMGQAAIRAREILLDPLPGESLFSLNTSKYNIAKKLNEALDKAWDETTPPRKVRAVSMLRNGGLIVELESESLATWLNKPSGKAAIEASLDLPVSFSQCTYSIVLEYLPIHSQIEE
ncbi:hypothetical protein BDR04DRAFT_1149865 [Suillus decipiens]|nr:hypothetical protein BDR04DRAFT_1149865 [Suillus decipiens]